jgi:hypothetical protein
MVRDAPDPAAEVEHASTAIHGKFLPEWKVSRVVGELDDLPQALLGESVQRGVHEFCQ